MWKFLITIVLASAVAPCWAVPQSINYQGYLTSAGGAPLDTIVSISFGIYDALADGDLIWSETHPAVVVSEGLFNVALGSLAPLSDDFTANRWLGITIGADAEMIPREQFQTVAHAFRVGTVDGATGGNIEGDVNISGKANIGIGNSNSGASAFVCGANNSATGHYSAVGGGAYNLAAGSYAVIGGGGGALPADSNRASANWSAILGGRANQAPQTYSTIGGGYANWALGQYAVVTGGRANYCGGNYSAILSGDSNYVMQEHVVVAGGHGNHVEGESAVCGGGTSNWINNAEYATISGGFDNTIQSDYATVAGGYSNNSSGIYATIGGGNDNVASATNATIAGGFQNNATSAATVVGGGYQNDATVAGATVAGGYYNEASNTAATVGGGYENLSNGYASTVAGGRYNNARGNFSVIAGGGGVDEADSNSVSAYCSIGGGSRNYTMANWANISGGYSNEATGSYCSIGGGYNNRTASHYSTVPGGQHNSATGEVAFAAGAFAFAAQNGSFVWSSGGDTTNSFATNSFTARAPGGVRFYTATSSTTVGATLPAGSGTWSSLSDSTTKRRFGRVNTRDILDKVTELPIERWSYKTQDENIQHVGPMAQDFYALFSLGEDNKTISMLDPSGVALAAIQELANQNRELRASIDKLQAQITSLQAGFTLTTSKDKRYEKAAILPACAGSAACATAAK